jgi:hypothetical protein
MTFSVCFSEQTILPTQRIVPKLKRCSLPEHPFTIMGLRDRNKVMLRLSEHHFISVAVIEPFQQHHTLNVFQHTLASSP